MSAAKVSAKSRGQATPKISYASLQRWNKWLAVLHAVQGLVILLLSVNRAFPVTTSYLGVDSLQTQSQGHVVLAAGTQQLFDVNLALLVATFLFIGAIAHGLMATKLRASYEKDLKKGINKIRWVEHAFSAGTMVVTIALLLGMQDISALLMLFGLTALASFFWLVVETYEQVAKQVNRLGFVIGAVARVLPWTILVIYAVSGSVYGSVPGYVYGILASLFVIFGCVAANAYLQYRKIGNWTNYLYGERVFMILSLVAKTVLAWQIFAGSLRP